MKNYMKMTVLAVAAATLVSSCTFVSTTDGFFSEFDKDVNINVHNLSSKDNFNGEVVEKQFEICDFDEIRLDGAADIEFAYGEPNVLISTKEDFFEYLSVNVNNGELMIKFTKNVKNAPKVNVKVTGRNLEEIEINGAGDIKCEENLESEKFSIDVNGASNIKLKSLKTGKADFDVKGAGETKIDNIDCEELVIDINGAGNARVAGSARKAKLEIAGAGKIDISGLDCPNVSKSISGVGKIKTK